MCPYSAELAQATQDVAAPWPKASCASVSVPLRKQAAVGAGEQQVQALVLVRSRRAR
jgi:hypothetical protein